MKLNEKILISLLLVFILIISAILVFGSALYLEGYAKLDERETVSSLGNAVQFLNITRENQLRLISDWAVWDDTYDFIRDPGNPDYIERNLVPETFRHLDIDLFVITDLNGTVVWGRAYDSSANTLAFPSKEVLLQIDAMNARMTGINLDKAESGIIGLSGGPMVIGTAPVLHTDGSGPVAGRLLIGTSLDASQTGRIASVSSPTLAFIPFWDERVSPGLRSVLLAGPHLDPVTVVRNASFISAYVLIDDIYGNPALVATIDDPRKSYIEGVSSLFRSILILLGIVALFGSLILILIDRDVLRRLRTLREAADKIRKGGMLSGDVDIGGNDELTDVATAFNRMIRTIADGKKDLTESEEKFRSLIETSPDMIWEMDRSGTVRYISPMVTAIMGYTPEEVIGRSLAFLVPEEEQPAAMQRLAWAFSTESPLPSVEIPARHRNGAALFLEIRPTRLTGPDGRLVGLRGVAVDITERRRAGDALRESEEKFRNLAENTADILFTLDMAGHITYVSPQVSRFGITPEELTESPFFSFIHPEDGERVRSRFIATMTEEKSSAFAFRIVDKSGRMFWVEERSTVLRDEQGEIRGLQGVIRDITDRKKAEDAIRLANRKLNLLNDITRHDIVNTLTGLLGTLDMVLDPSTGDDRELLLADIRQLALNIQRQIEFTREYQAVGVKEPVWQDVSRIIRHAADLSAGSDVAIINDVEDFGIFADPLLGKVFYNLIQNALRYGKNITTIRFTERISDRGFAIVCEDNGGGIAPDMKEKIFERGIGRNTGMGLFLSREILAITGITMRENGMFGVGARFEMIIPTGGYRFHTHDDIV